MSLVSYSNARAVATARLAFLAICAGVASFGRADSLPPIPEVVARMRQAENVPGSWSGRERITISRVGIPVPDGTDPNQAADMLDGEYRWFLRGTDWWMTKEFPRTSPAFGSGMDIKVIRNYKDQVLSYVDFRDQRGDVYFLTAHLDQTHYQAAVGPWIGRRWNKGSTADLLQALTEVRERVTSAGIEFDGLYKGVPTHLTVSPRYGYLTTKLLIHPSGGRFGFSISEARRLGDAWVPVIAELVNGDYNGNELTQGYTGRLELSDLAQSRAPSPQEAPPIPPGITLGSEDNRLYRTAQDGALIDWGRQGYKPGGTLAWGSLFVLSGAGLLLGSLSWIFFRNRRSPPRSPLASRR